MLHVHVRAARGSALLLMMLAGSVAFGQSVAQGVRGLGAASGVDLKAKDQALAEAKRNAVEQACGAIINAQSQVEDFELKRDRILSTAAGYITDYSVTREWNDGEVSYCEIRASVSVGRFEDDWKAMFAHLREDMDNPRCLIVITEDNDVDDANPPKANGVVQSMFENYFLGHDMQLVDKSTADDVQQRNLDRAAIEDDVAGLAAIAAAFQADVVVYGRAEAKYGGTGQAGSVTVHKWNVTLNVKVVQADSARILASNTYGTDKPFTTTSTGGADKGFRQLAEDTSAAVLYDLGEAWKKRLTSHQNLLVKFEGCSRTDFSTRIKPALLALRGVQQGEEGVKIRDFLNSIVSVEVYWAYSLNSLADEIEQLNVPGMSFEIVEQSANTLRVKVAQAP